MAIGEVTPARGMKGVAWPDRTEAWHTASLRGRCSAVCRLYVTSRKHRAGPDLAFDSFSDLRPGWARPRIRSGCASSVARGPHFAGQGFELAVGVVAGDQRPRVEPPRIAGAGLVDRH